MFTPEFDQKPPVDAEKFPEELRRLSRSERALRYPEAIGCAHACDSLETCIQASSGSADPYRAEDVSITNDLVKRFADLQGYRGRKGQLVTFVFRDCNVATTLLLLPETHRPVAMIGFIAELEE